MDRWTQGVVEHRPAPVIRTFVFLCCALGTRISIRSTRGSSRGEIQPHSRHGSELASADRYSSAAIVRDARPGCSGEGRISLQYEPDKKF